jgi:hypothetical protein
VAFDLLCQKRMRALQRRISDRRPAIVSMNTLMSRLFNPGRIVLLVSFGLATLQTKSRAVTLSVTPSVISNTYPGVVQLNIGGLTNGEVVIVRKWLDLNANGLIDSDEPLIDVFKVADGGAMIIGGVTNISVPFDSNPAAGSITTSLSVSPALILENMVGQCVYQVVSPSGRFSPVTATFAVTNGTMAQSIAGTIYSDGVPFAHGVVVAQDQQANNPAGAVVADDNGHFSLSLPPSSYNLIGGAPNCYYDFSTAPSIVLSNGLTATNDVYVTSGTTTIAGAIYDSSSSNGIGGLLMTLQSGNLFAIAFTDTNGNYSAAVAPSFWKVEPAKERLSRRAYVQSDTKYQFDASAGNVTNANIPLYKGNALFYGRFTDSSNSPYANLEVDGGCQGFDAKGLTDSNGYYAVAVLGDGTNYWAAQATDSKNSIVGNYVVNTYNGTTVSPGQTVLENFVALRATAHISGRVQDNAGASVVGVTLMAGAQIDSLNYQAVESTTDNSGNYSFAVASGQWNLQFLTGGFQDNLDTHGYVDLTGPHYASVPPTNVVANITVFPIGTPAITQAQRMSPSQFGFTVLGASNVTYTVQFSTNLLSTNWANLFSLIFTNDAVFVTDPHATNNARYYRVRKN